MIPVILSGGSGTRLWPKSRASCPKQFAELLEESLQLKTLKRLKNLGEPWVLTVRDLEVLTKKTLNEAGVPVTNAIYEPFGQNTGPAIALLCYLFMAQNKQDKIVGIFPADHLIENMEGFAQAVKLGEEFAQKDQVVTIGIKPNYPATGYGYIEVDLNQFQSGTESRLKVYKTKNFREKPNEVTAQKFIDKGNFFWNAGMFIFKVKIMAEHMQRFMPETWHELKNLKPDISNISVIYKRLKNESIDYAVMEKLEEQVCVPCEIGWTDLGSWDEISKYKKNEDNVIEASAQNNFVSGIASKSYAFSDVDNLVVVDTPDAILITQKGKTQNVKNLTNVIKEKKPSLLKDHVFEHRPWGVYEILRDSKRFKSKVIHVNPGQQLSYQSHTKRAEHWIITNGNPEVILDDKMFSLKPGEHIFIPQGSKHRMRNPGTEAVEFVEVQIGSYFGEDDITRYSDA